jgi:mannosyltransferase OCH1-like enzyme
MNNLIYILIFSIIIIFILFFNINQVISIRERTDHFLNETIPKIIIQTWKSNEIPVKYKPLIESVKKINHDYQYIFFTDDDIDNFIKINYPNYYQAYLKLPVKIQKIDFFRYIAVYHYGGFYFDLDMNSIEPLNNLLDYDCIFPVDQHINYSKCNKNR